MLIECRIDRAKSFIAKSEMRALKLLQHVWSMCVLQMITQIPNFFPFSPKPYFLFTLGAHLLFGQNAKKSSKI